MPAIYALDLAPHGIRSNTIAPTFIETPLTKPLFEDPAFKVSLLSKIKLGRVGQVEDLMGAVVFLASEASARDKPDHRRRLDGRLSERTGG